METDCLHFNKTGYFSKIILDYLAGEEQLAPFYHYTPDLEIFKSAIENKSFSSEHRKVLVDSLNRQYKEGGIKLKIAPQVEENILALEQEETFTVTTGHQLCLFTGPLYFIYKIVSAIKLARTLKSAYPQHNFVPVYWMATEDHDFEEINHFHFKGKKLQWNTDQTGAVGRMNTASLDTVFNEFKDEIVDYSTHGEELKSLFERSYLQHNNLADATRFLVNELFSAYGVVVLDGDDASLKQQLIPLVKDELLNEVSSELVSQQSKALAKQYKIQVNAREINLFYLTDESRNRIVKENDTYFINDTSLSFSEREILQELEEYPERN